ncbi:hypothetical protein [Nonomuraea jabiensis]|uniref:hypothetical protein n=1 Tax=Nonomuraea jabiensis TaxID=882448 RepID=UPI0036A56CE3
MDRERISEHPRLEEAALARDADAAADALAQHLTLTAAELTRSIHYEAPRKEA